MPLMYQINLTRGELSPLLGARFDLDHYRAGLGRMSGWVPLRYGGATKSPGTLFRGFTKFPDRRSRGMSFMFSRAQTYNIEVGHNYFRFRTLEGAVLAGGVPYEIATPYKEEDLRFLQWRQIGDVMYLACAGYRPHTLTRLSETNWVLAPYITVDGPYLDINLTSTTMDASGVSGAVTITASSAAPINGGAGFQEPGDIGRSLRYLNSNGRWYWFRITDVTSPTEVSAEFGGTDAGSLDPMPNHDATKNWRLGSWSDFHGWPRAVGFFEERLLWGGTDRQRTHVWATVSQATEYSDFSVQAPVLEDDSLTAVLTGGQLEVIQWMADGFDIVLGTEGSLRALGENGTDKAFGPLNYRQRSQTAIPASSIPGFFIENVLVFLDVYNAQLYEAIYSTEARAYVAKELSSLNEHLLAKGVTSIAYQKTPHKIIWASTRDGDLLAITYDRDQEVFGVSEVPVGNGGIVEDVMTLPGRDRDGDQLWLTVRREIGGEVVRTIETLAAFYRVGLTDQVAPVYGYCGGIYDGAPTRTLDFLQDFAGETFGVWADAIDVGDATVDEDGVLELPDTIDVATKIVWGYRTSRLMRTLRLADTGQGEPSAGKPLNVARAYIDLYQTGTLRVGAGHKTVDDYDDGLDYIRPDDNSEQNPYEAYQLRDGYFEAVMDGDWESNGVLTIESNSMYPATVLAIRPDVEATD